MRSRDTSAEARAVQLGVYRSMSPVQRLEVAIAMSDELMAVTVAGIRSRRPGISDAEVRSELGRILGHRAPVQ